MKHIVIVGRDDKEINLVKGYFEWETGAHCLSLNILRTPQAIEYLTSRLRSGELDAMVVADAKNVTRAERLIPYFEISDKVFEIPYSFFYNSNAYWGETSCSFNYFRKNWADSVQPGRTM